MVQPSAEISRWVGIIAAALGAISATFVMPYDPVWALLDIILAILVIYGLSAQYAEKTAWRRLVAPLWLPRSRRSPGRGGPSSCWSSRWRWPPYPGRPGRPPRAEYLSGTALRTFGHTGTEALADVAATAFCLPAYLGTVGLAGRARKVLEPKVGPRTLPSSATP